ncbi:MAG TPA: hypothetical protein VGB50_07230 [Flavobacterium sp.]
MSNRKRDPKSLETKIIWVSFFVLCLGYFMLNYVATWESPLLGNTFHIVFGCVFIAVSVITMFLAIKSKYFPKKKKKTSRPIFLDDRDKKSKSDR